MSTKTDDHYFRDMLDHARRARAIVASISREQYEDDDTQQLALTHLLQIVGEAASRVSAAARDAHPELPWADMIGMRHRLVHDYGNVSRIIVWDTATDDLPRTIEALEQILESSAD